jgi:diguanylate cyclase (GGDEF)-like protein
LYLTYRRGTNLVDGTHFQAQLRQEIEKARRRNAQFPVIFLDVADFKRINYDYGHRTGDES